MEFKVVSSGGKQEFSEIFSFSCLLSLWFDVERREKKETIDLFLAITLAHFAKLASDKVWMSMVQVWETCSGFMANLPVF